MAIPLNLVQWRWQQGGAFLRDNQSDNDKSFNSSVNRILNYYKTIRLKIYLWQKKICNNNSARGSQSLFLSAVALRAEKTRSKKITAIIKRFADAVNCRLEREPRSKKFADLNKTRLRSSGWFWALVYLRAIPALTGAQKPFRRYRRPAIRVRSSAVKIRSNNVLDIHAKPQLLAMTLGGYAGFLFCSKTD